MSQKKIRIVVFIIMFCFCLPFSVLGQNLGSKVDREAEKSQPLSLSQIVDLFLQKSYSQNLRKINFREQEIDLQNQKAVFLPDIKMNFKFSQHYYLKNQYLFGDEYTKEYNSLQGDMTITENFPWNAELSFTSSLAKNYYNNHSTNSFGNTLNFRYYLFKKNINKLNYKSSSIQLKNLSLQQKVSLQNDLLGLAQSYYNVLKQKIQLNITQKQLLRNRKLATMARIKFQNGMINILDKNQIELDVRNSEFALKKQKQELHYKLNILATQVGVKNISDIKDKFEIYQWEDDNLNLEANPNIQSMNQQEKSAKISYQLTQSSFDWYFIIGGSYNWQGSGENLDEFSNSFSTDNYNAYLGIELPIYDGNINKNNLLKNRLQMRELEYQIDHKKEELTTRWNFLTEQIKLLFDEMDFLRENIRLAEDNLTLATNKFLQGQIGFTEWKQIEQQLDHEKYNLVEEKTLLNEYILERKMLSGNLGSEIFN